MHIAVNTYFRRVSCWWNAHLFANHIIYNVSGTIFPRRSLWGGLKCDGGVKLTFFKNVFIFFQKWVWRQLHTLSLWTPLREAILWAKPMFYLGNLMLLLKTINFTKGIWYFSSLVGLWGAPGVSGVLFGIFFGSLRLDLWPWKLSGVLFACFWACFRLLSKLLDIPWKHFS